MEWSFSYESADASSFELNIGKLMVSEVMVVAWKAEEGMKRLA